MDIVNKLLTMKIMGTKSSYLPVPPKKLLKSRRNRQGPVNVPVLTGGFCYKDLEDEEVKNIDHWME